MLIIGVYAHENIGHYKIVHSDLCSCTHGHSKSCSKPSGSCKSIMESLSVLRRVLTRISKRDAAIFCTSWQLSASPYLGYCQACNIQGHTVKWCPVFCLMTTLTQAPWPPRAHYAATNTTIVGFLIVGHRTMLSPTCVISPFILYMTAPMTL